MNEPAKYPQVVITRLLYVNRYYYSFLPRAKASVTREKRVYEQMWPGVNAEASRLLEELNSSPPSADTSLDSKQSIS